MARKPKTLFDGRLQAATSRKPVVISIDYSAMDAAQGESREEGREWRD
jgi:hypothetical protein